MSVLLRLESRDDAYRIATALVRVAELDREEDPAEADACFQLADGMADGLEQLPVTVTALSGGTVGP